MIVVCPKCKTGFDPLDKKVTMAAVVAGMAGGAKLGGGFGIVGGTLGAIAGTIPGALLGGLAGLGLSSKMKICPKCKNVFIPKILMDHKIHEEFQKIIRDLENENLQLNEKHRNAKNLNRVLLVIFFVSFILNFYLLFFKK